MDSARQVNKTQFERSFLESDGVLCRGEHYPSVSTRSRSTWPLKLALAPDGLLL
jgi:hypothetical protein